MKLKVCSFETRSAEAMRALIERHGGQATVVPTVRESPATDAADVAAFGRELMSGRFDVVLFLTGVGAQLLLEQLAGRYSRGELAAALNRCTVAVRGPKPAAVLRHWHVSVGVRAQPPHTWHELVDALHRSAGLGGKRVAVQEYGRVNHALHEALRQHGVADVRSVVLYRWSLPEDLEPLRSAVRATIDGQFDVLAFTTAVQLDHVLAVAEQMGLRREWLAAAARCVIASIGPSTSEAIRDAGLPVDIEPQHSKLGHLVNAIFDQARCLIATCRARSN